MAKKEEPIETENSEISTAENLAEQLVRKITQAGGVLKMERPEPWPDPPPVQEESGAETPETESD